MRTETHEIKTVEVYATQDGKRFDNKDEAIRHERYLTLQEILTQQGCDLNSETKATLYALSNHFDEFLDKLYERKVLSKFYGRRDDF